jgi:hypothetical protein
MRWAKQVAQYCAVASLAMATWSQPCLAQRNRPHSTPPPRQQAAPPAQAHPQHESGPEQAQVQARQPGHSGDWLRRYKDLAPDEQEKALQNDPAFQKLPPERQQLLRHRLQRFSSLPPEKQLQVLNRMETWEHLTPEQKAEARQIHAQMHQLPPERQGEVRKAVRELRAMPPAQREQVINSDQFKSMFSEQERGIMREVTQLPLAPPEEGEAAPQE